MYDGKTVSCFILARGGSKGVPRKNVKMLAGKPLISHSIDLAKQVKYIDKVYVSTEDKEIKRISEKSGAIVINRPVELASDTAVYLEAVQNMILQIPNLKDDDMVLLLETTSPIRKVSDVENCIEMFDKNTDCVMSITKVKIHPAYMYKFDHDYLVPHSSILPKNRQEMEILFAYTGSILVTTIKFLKNQKDIPYGGRMKGYVLGEKESLDIDSLLDFQICDLLLRHEQNER
jgi:CMP-N-acetylneuraminic acid synthetase